MADTRCRHRTFWALGGVWLWCYRCGALLCVGGRWTRPVGPRGDNPAGRVFHYAREARKLERAKGGK